VRRYAVLFGLGLVVYGLLSWDRLVHPSFGPHFVYQAEAWLHGRASIELPVPGGWGLDWAKVQAVELDDGSIVRGRFNTQHQFRALDGTQTFRFTTNRFGPHGLTPAPVLQLEPVPVRRIIEETAYVGFPPLPTVLLLPSAAISGRAGNEGLPNLLVTASILPLALLMLRRLAAAGFSRRSEREDLWLVTLLAFGTVLFYVALQCSVWHLAHVCGVALALVFVWASIEAAHPWIAGIAIGAVALTRTPMAFMFPVFVWEAWRVHRADRRSLARALVQFAVPIALFATAGGAYNVVRFGSPLEFGHRYLEIRQQIQIEQYGLMSPHFLLRNLCVALLQLPIPVGHSPWLQISGHGLALWFTTPALALVISRGQAPIRRALWISCAFVALPSLLYHNSGWTQFGYRFSLDYIVLLIALIATRDRPLTSVGKGLIVASIVVNLAGALVYDRANWRFFQFDYDRIRLLGGAASVSHY
jgi:hypothetical protein